MTQIRIDTIIKDVGVVPNKRADKKVLDFGLTFYDNDFRGYGDRKIRNAVFGKRADVDFIQGNAVLRGIPIGINFLVGEMDGHEDR